MLNLKKLFLAIVLGLAVVPVNAVGKSDDVNMKDKMSQETAKPRSSTFIYEQERAWEPAGDGVARQILGYDDRIMLVKVKFEKDAVGTPHRHYHTQTTYVVSGKFKFTVDGQSKLVGPGDGIYMEPDVLHGCVCIEPGVLIDCFSPVRIDFLK